LLEIKKRAVENLRKAGFKSVVLVPVLVKGVNDNQVGDIIRYAVENKDVVRAINFQPVSITGRINKEKRDQMRITIPDLMDLTTKQTNGLIKQKDWFPVPAAQPLTRFLSSAQDEKFVDFPAHPHCGMATYLIIDNGEVHPITNYLEVDETLEAFSRAEQRIKEGKETRAKLQLLASLVRSVKFGKLSEYIRDVVLHSDYLSLNKMHHDMILIGSMHFMDPYNYDVERVQRCVIHYATPEGTIVPFCTMNTLHRQRIEKKYSQPLDNKNVTPLYDVESLTQKIIQENNNYEMNYALIKEQEKQSLVI